MPSAAARVCSRFESIPGRARRPGAGGVSCTFDGGCLGGLGRSGEAEGCGACKAARRGEASSRAGSQSPLLMPGVISGEDSASDLVQLAMATAAASAAAEAAAAKAAAATAEARAAEAEARAAEAEARAAEAEMRMLEAERQIAGGREAGRLDCCRA